VRAPQGGGDPYNSSRDRTGRAENTAERPLEVFRRPRDPGGDPGKRPRERERRVKFEILDAEGNPERQGEGFDPYDHTRVKP